MEVYNILLKKSYRESTCKETNATPQRKCLVGLKFYIFQTLLRKDNEFI